MRGFMMRDARLQALTQSFSLGLRGIIQVEGKGKAKGKGEISTGFLNSLAVK